MSRIGSATIQVPQGVTVNFDNDKILIKGTKGELNLDIHSKVKVEIKNDTIQVLPQNEADQEARALWGTFRMLISNMIEGVMNGYQKQLEINGTGYKASMQGKNLVMELGYSHSVQVEAPEGITFEVDKNVITVSGIDKQLVGQWAAIIRSKRKVEPYKGKGIKYVGEYVRSKVGKKAGGEGA